MEEFIGKVTSIENYKVNGELNAQSIRLLPEKKLDFKPGQYMLLAKEGFSLRARPSELKWSSYSIASSPKEKELEFAYTIRWSGGFTQHLAETLKEGSQLQLKGPFGNFFLKQNQRENLLIATGAGITPIMSMLRTLVPQKAPCTLYYGFRTSEHCFFQEELKELANLPFLRLFFATSREGDRCYVQDLLKAAALPQEAEAYICGNPKMVKEVRDLLLEKGLPQERINAEQW